MMLIRPSKLGTMSSFLVIFEPWTSFIQIFREKQNFKYSYKPSKMSVDRMETVINT